MKAKTIFQRVFARNGEAFRPAMPNSAVSSELTQSDIEQYYLRVISDCMRRMLVPADTVEIGVRRSGTGSNGLTAFSGYIRFLKWDPTLTPVILQNMPVIDGRIRRVAAASVILEHTHFAGLWFQATSETEGSPTVLVGMPAELVHQPGG
jgi:hypothetical protein